MAPSFLCTCIDSWQSLYANWPSWAFFQPMAGPATPMPGLISPMAGHPSTLPKARHKLSAPAKKNQAFCRLFPRFPRGVAACSAAKIAENEATFCLALQDIVSDGSNANPSQMYRRAMFEFFQRPRIKVFSMRP